MVIMKGQELIRFSTVFESHRERNLVWVILLLEPLVAITVNRGTNKVTRNWVLAASHSHFPIPQHYPNNHFNNPGSGSLSKGMSGT